MARGTGRQTSIDEIAGAASMLYLFFALAGGVWLLFDTWIDAHSLPRMLGYDITPLRASAHYHTVVNAVVGGSIGGVVNGLRSALRFSKGFDHRYLWKYLFAPWMGAALSLVAFAVLTTTAVIMGGQGPAAEVGSPQLLSNFAMGALAGYGSKDVLIWLDAQVQKLFAVTEAVPNVEGQPEAVAVSRLEARDLAVGVVEPIAAGAFEPGRVVSQMPSPGSRASRGDSVDLTVALRPREVPA
jgi:hypothetical protein